MVQRKMDEKILIVDDDLNALAGFRRNLSAYFNLYTAPSAAEAFTIIEKHGPFAVIVSDYKMPYMDGNEFLKKVKDLFPETVRMMLTGYAEIKIAIDAINDDNVFRFLTKPCNTDLLIKNIKSGIEQYRLITAEKELLEKTLKGSINVLIDILSLLNPQIFNTANKLKQMAKNIATKLRLKNTWGIEIATLLSQIGCIAIPQNILEKKFSGSKLTEDEENLFNTYPQIGKQILAHIPRLEEVSKIISYQLHDFSNNNIHQKFLHNENLLMATKILNVLINFDLLLKSGKSEQEALELMRKSNKFDSTILAALDAELAGIYDGLTLLSVELEELKVGVILAEDIKDEDGKVLITKGSEISQASLSRLINYSKFGKIITPIKILVYLDNT